MNKIATIFAGYRRQTFCGLTRMIRLRLQKTARAIRRPASSVRRSASGLIDLAGGKAEARVSLQAGAHANTFKRIKPGERRQVGSASAAP